MKLFPIISETKKYKQVQDKTSTKRVKDKITCAFRKRGLIFSQTLILLGCSEN